MTTAQTVREERLLRAISNTTDPEQLAELQKKLTRERRRSRRVQNLEPPLKRQRVTVILDRPTELAVEYIQQYLKTHRPAGGKAKEFSEFHREVLREAAQKLGWDGE